MPHQPDLSVVVPVYNAAATLVPLVHDLVSTSTHRVQVVLVDDSSRDTSPDIVDLLAREHDDVVALHHSANAGAGAARNTGFAHADGRYTLFFDADDLVRMPAVLSAVDALDATGADVAMTPYRLSCDDGVRRGMHDVDARIWREVGHGTTGRARRLTDVSRLLTFTAYPWNKVLRTSTYRSTGLRFGETPVHNDVLGHWMSLLPAHRLVLLDEPTCIHVVRSHGANLTNRTSHDRLALFDALDETHAMLTRNPLLLQQFIGEYWTFAVRTMAWASDRITAEHLPEFRARRREHLLSMSLGDFARLRFGGDHEVADGVLSGALA